MPRPNPAHMRTIVNHRLRGPNVLVVETFTVHINNGHSSQLVVAALVSRPDVLTVDGQNVRQLGLGGGGTFDDIV